ncbi:DUF4350 domain-containing protein [Alcanivorax quisquiliarum]|uniref:DUF4350 domain-containing protein n=1 Tax=Alcanivorax quisquiliarum TaxID=2933565 RepID=A0ABT0E8Y0_9GAMM|nr:DUF4350 domain-containing protein [Alcanivorax quisquiliarum]MCK0538306.1 hypothetical protein [Alcanivorax quisquiliarum]
MRWRLLLVLALVALAIYCASRFERRSHVVHVPPEGEVLRNPMLAAGTLLEARGRKVRYLLGTPGLFPLPGHDTLIIMDQHRSGLGTAQIEALYQWLAEGGMMLVQAAPMANLDQEYAADDARWQRHDPLLFPLSLTAQRAPENAQPDAGFEAFFGDWLSPAGNLFQRLCHAADDPAMTEECRRLLCDNPLRWQDTEVETHDGVRYVGFAPDVVLTVMTVLAEQAIPNDDATEKAATPDHENMLHREKNAGTVYLPGEPKAAPTPEDKGGVWASHDDATRQLHYLRGRLSALGATLTAHSESRQGPHLVQFRIGAGRLLVTADLGPWRNDQLHYLDHAELLDYFTREHRQVWFVRGVQMERLPAWLWRHAAPLAFSLALLLVLLVWRQLPRRQVQRDEATGQPGDFLDHLLASGRLLWRTGNADALLAPLRTEVRRLMQRHRPAQDASHASEIATAARLSACTEAQVQRALGARPRTLAEFTDLVATLQQLRRTL